MINIWIVEDNIEMSKIYETIINSSDEMICTFKFSTFEEFYKALAINTQPDIVLLDIGLPGISGIKGLPLIKTNYPKVKVIIQTVFEDNEKIFQAICAGASGYLLKRTLPNKIIENIKEVMDGGAPINSQIAKKVLEMFSNYVVPQSDYKLTNREKEILSMVVNGDSVKSIAKDLNLSFFTVGTHIKNIYSKLQVNTRSAVVAKTLKERLI